MWGSSWATTKALESEQETEHSSDWDWAAATAAATAPPAKRLRAVDLVVIRSDQRVKMAAINSSPSPSRPPQSVVTPRLLLQCANCGVNAGITKHKLCGGCRLVRYCSVKCQKQDWGRGGHKENCLVHLRRNVNVVPVEHLRRSVNVVPVESGDGGIGRRAGGEKRSAFVLLADDTLLRVLHFCDHTALGAALMTAPAVRMVGNDAWRALLFNMEPSLSIRDANEAQHHMRTQVLLRRRADQSERAYDPERGATTHFTEISDYQFVVRMARDNEGTPNGQEVLLEATIEATVEDRLFHVCTFALDLRSAWDATEWLAMELQLAKVSEEGNVSADDDDDEREFWESINLTIHILHPKSRKMALLGASRFSDFNGTIGEAEQTYVFQSMPLGDQLQPSLESEAQEVPQLVPVLYCTHDEDEGGNIDALRFRVEKWDNDDIDFDYALADVMQLFEGLAWSNGACCTPFEFRFFLRVSNAERMIWQGTLGAKHTEDGDGECEIKVDLSQISDLMTSPEMDEALKCVDIDEDAMQMISANMKLTVSIVRPDGKMALLGTTTLKHCNSSQGDVHHNFSFCVIPMTSDYTRDTEGSISDYANYPVDTPCFEMKLNTSHDPKGGSMDELVFGIMKWTSDGEWISNFNTAQVMRLLSSLPVFE